MKRIFVTLFTWMSCCFGFAQEQLHIHQINVENGDATMIGIWDESTKSYTSKILIDGGETKADEMLLPYLKKIVGEDAKSLHFDYLVLTHYHTDHYNGLLALKDGRLTADSIVDPGGYKVASYFKHTGVAGTKPANLVLADTWLQACKAASNHLPKPFVKGRSKILIKFDASSKSSIGRSLNIGTVGGNEVLLTCIAGWGNTLAENGKIVKNPYPDRNNPNNFTLAFVLSCGEFRYFIGGDMGGSSKKAYIDQESSVTKYLSYKYPLATSMKGDSVADGHLCGFKANHHGSKESNSPAFIKNMYPSIVLSSGGDKSQWHLPNPEYVERLANIRPLSQSDNLADGFYNIGLYFTNLYDFKAGYPSYTTANNLFKNKEGVSYYCGNAKKNAKHSFIIKVNKANTLSEKSEFEVGVVELESENPYRSIAKFKCHKK